MSTRDERTLILLKPDTFQPWCDRWLDNRVHAAHSKASARPET